jgi:hypothetical protein
VLDVDGEMPELRASPLVRASGGRFWWLLGDRIVGCIGMAPANQAGGIELKLYVAGSSEIRLGSRLVDLVEAEARARRATFIDPSGDTRFTTARLYEKRGYTRSSQTRGAPRQERHGRILLSQSYSLIGPRSRSRSRRDHPASDGCS